MPRSSRFQDPTEFANNLLGSWLQYGDYSLRLSDVLGKGAFGVIFRADEYLGQTKTDRQYAVKCIQGEYSDRFIARECRLHSHCAKYSSTIAQLSAIIEGNAIIYLVMDYFPDGDLFNAIITRETFVGQDDLIREAFLQIAGAVKTCHDHGVFHRDIKPENVLCRLPSSDRDPLVLALADFGLATMDEYTTEFGVGSQYYTSLECGTRHDVYGDPCPSYSSRSNDVWGLGVLLLNLACSRNPWARAAPDDQAFNAYCQDPDHLMKILPITRELSDALIPVFLPAEGNRCSIEDLIQRVSQIERFTLDWNELCMAPSAVRKASGPLCTVRHAQWQASATPSLVGTNDSTPTIFSSPFFTTDGFYPREDLESAAFDRCETAATAFSPDRSPQLPDADSGETLEDGFFSRQTIPEPASFDRLYPEQHYTLDRSVETSSLTPPPPSTLPKPARELYWPGSSAFRSYAGDRIMVR